MWKLIWTCVFLAMAAVSGCTSANLSDDEVKAARHNQNRGPILAFLIRLSSDGRLIAGAVTAVALGVAIWSTVSVALQPSLDGIANSLQAVFGCVMVLFGLPYIYSASPVNLAVIAPAPHRDGSADGRDSFADGDGAAVEDSDPTPVDDDGPEHSSRRRR
jgi:hypothetical protein